jgi:hypothetical protein
VEVNYDCMDVIEVRREHGPTMAMYEKCVLLCRGFYEVLFSHYPRKANMLTYVLARFRGIILNRMAREPLILLFLCWLKIYISSIHN